MDIDTKELEKYLNSSLGAIKKGVETGDDFRIIDPVEFDLAVTNVKEGGGGLKIYVANANAQFKMEQISHIRIRVHPHRKANGKMIRKAEPTGSTSVA